MNFPNPFHYAAVVCMYVIHLHTCLGLYVVRERERKKDPPCFVESCLCVQLLVDLVTCNPDFEVSSGVSVIKWIGFIYLCFYLELILPPL